MKIPFHRPYITSDEIGAVSELLKSGWLTMGGKTIEFENKFKSYIGTQNAVSVNSATAALHLALKAIDLAEGDEVIVPAMTFAATAEVVRYFNAKPVLVDVDRDTQLIDVALIEKKITRRTRAVIPVHYAGQPCDMNEILSLARGRNLAVIEDAAHALPSWYNGSKIGIHGDLVCYSFYATKTLTTGEGGMICTGNDSWADRIRILRLHGITRNTWERVQSETPWTYDIEELGYKYNTSDIASAIGIEQLKKLDFMWEKRVRIAERYSRAFGGRDDLSLYTIKKDRVSSWYLYPVNLVTEALKITRDQFINELSARGIGLSVHFIPLYFFTYYKKMGYGSDEFRNCNWIYPRSFSLPIFPGMLDHEVEYVIENVIEVLNASRR